MGLKDRIKQKAQESKIIPHPLIQKDIDISTKNAYLGGVVFAALLDDAEITEPEHKRIRELGISLQLGDDDIKEVISTVENLKSEDEQEAYLEEIIPALKDRDVALFFICDFSKTVGADGKYTQDDLDYCDAIAEWLDLNENDMAFYKEYRNYLLPGKEMECAVFITRHSNVSKLPNSFYEFTCPDAIDNQAVIQEQSEFFSKAVRLLSEEIGTLFQKLDEEELNKRTMEERDLVKSLREKYPEYCQTRFRVTDLAKKPEDINQLVKWLCSVMKQKYPEVNMAFVAQTAFDELRKDIESAAMWKTYFDFSPDSACYGNYEDYYHIDGKGYKSEARKDFRNIFRNDDNFDYFKKMCEELVKGYIFRSSDFNSADSPWGFRLFKLIILKVLFVSLKKDFHNKELSISELPELSITEKDKYQLRDILRTRIKDSFEYADYIEYNEDWDGEGAKVDFERAIKEIEYDMERAYIAVENEYFEVADNNTKIAKDYFKKLISEFPEILPLES
jgi:hypothetical protein